MEILVLTMYRGRILGEFITYDNLEIISKITIVGPVEAKGNVGSGGMLSCGILARYKESDAFDIKGKKHQFNK